jgi:serine/threonine protein kinase
MNYCVTPGCFNPENPDSARFCLTCGSKLWLQERFRPIKLLGQGGFGRTFLVVDEGSSVKSSYVLKQLCLQNQNSLILKKAVQLFRQEAAHLDTLGKHPQIPTLLAHFEQNRRLYLVQELVEGQTLEAELQQGGVFSEAQIWEVLGDLLPVLKFVHDRNVIHRDIKPTNIIRRCRDRKPVLIDFGVAKIVSTTALLQTGTMVGTAEYVSPEQTKGKAFPASDLYSLGVTCLHLLTNCSPFDLIDIVNNRWVWRDYLPQRVTISDRLGRILDKLVESTLSQRFQSVTDVLQAIESTATAQTFVQSKESNGLMSAVGIDYEPLRMLLVRKRWKEADQLTWDYLCQALGKFPGYYLKMSDIQSLPCEDLWAINELWVTHSQGRFGFSVQKYIYEEVGGDYPSFCDRVGWSVHNSHHPDSDFQFNRRAPLGHLPSRRWVGGYSWWRHASALAAKLTECGIL